MIFVLWSNKKVLDGDASFKEDLYPMFTTSSIEALTQPFVLCYHHVRVGLLIVVVHRTVGAISVVILGWSFGLDLHPIESSCRILTFLRAFNRCCSSCCNSWRLEHIVLTLWYRVPTTLYLDDIVWWLL